MIAEGQGTVYLIHFEGKVGGRAEHYVGWTTDLAARVQAHIDGSGSKLMAEVVRLGLGWNVVRTWRGSRTDERRLKNRKRRSLLCPICNPDHWATNAPKGCMDRYSATSEEVGADPQLANLL